MTLAIRICRHCVALTDDGRVYGWGWGQLGQLGVCRRGQEFLVIDAAESEVRFCDGCLGYLLSKQPEHERLLRGGRGSDLRLMHVSGDGLLCSDNVQYQYGNATSKHGTAAVAGAGSDYEVHMELTGKSGRKEDLNSGGSVITMSPPETNDQLSQSQSHVQEGVECQEVVHNDQVHGICILQPLQMFVCAGREGMVDAEGRCSGQSRLQASTCSAQWWHTLIVLQ
jgi:hypothetical protein